MDRLIEFPWLQDEIIGHNSLIPTPFGLKPLIYADYTASGRSLRCIESAIANMLPFYANTHTEDDFTGKCMSHLYNQAEDTIKRLTNAGPSGKVIPVGTGSTGALQRLSSILGIYIPPVTRALSNLTAGKFLQENGLHGDSLRDLQLYFEKHRPVVFIGPYEHHSNEILWREGMCDVKKVPFGANGLINLHKLEELLQDPDIKHRTKIGCFSAASNVTGILTPVYDIAKILHRNHALACFDFAASAPYVEINMNRDHESYFDAISFSPHKFLGGPASSGILIINEKIYRKELPPSISGGGTVSFVSETKENYIDDIEAREIAGTPGILQTIRTALAMQIKEKISIENIHKNESHLMNRFIENFASKDNLVIYGPLNSELRINIFPFNIKHGHHFLHPKFVTKLLCDLFGIQTRAGCSCAGPYGHQVLNISEEFSSELTHFMEKTGYFGLKPGWVRFNLHYSLTQLEVKYLFNALDFILQFGHRFLNIYSFDLKSGEWTALTERTSPTSLKLELSEFLNHKINLQSYVPSADFFAIHLDSALKLALTLPERTTYLKCDGIKSHYMYFDLCHLTN